MIKYFAKRYIMRYHHIAIKLSSKYSPPYFIGSQLRGAFGHALKKVTCINPSYQCTNCFGAKSCLYHSFYEQENIQHKYRFDIELGSLSYDFGLYLYSDACDKLPYILSSLHIALSENGLGKDRVVFDNITIQVNGITIYEDGSFSNTLDDIKPQKFQPDNYHPNIKLKLLTPLRIKKSNQLEYNKINIEHILRSIYQRYKQIFEDTVVYSLDYKPTYITSVKVFEYKPLYRKSIRQGKRLVMDGVLGEIAVLGIDQKSYELLKLGEIIGVGKQTTFGMGKIKIEEVK